MQISRNIETVCTNKKKKVKLKDNLFDCKDKVTELESKGYEEGSFVIDCNTHTEL